MVNNSKQIAKNTVYLYIRMVLVLFVTFFLSRVLLKTLGVEDYGTYNVVGSIVTFFGFIQQALTNATYRFISYGIGTGNKDDTNVIYSMAIKCHLLLALLFFVLLEFVGVWFLNNHLNIDPERINAANFVFQFTIITTCLGIIQTPFYSNIVAHEHMGFYAILSIVDISLKLLAAILLPYISIDNLILYAGALNSISIITLIMSASYTTRHFKDVIYINKWDKSVLFQFAKYSGWSIIVNGAEITALQSISIFFNWFIGVVGNAALAIANQVNSGLNQFVNNLCQAFNPQIIKSYASGDKMYFMKLIFTASKLSYSLLLLVSIPVVFNLKFILNLWLGDLYPPMTPVFIYIILISYAFDSFQTPLWHAVHATGNLKTHQLLIGSIKVLAIPAMYITIRLTNNPYYMLGVWAIDTCICAIVRTIYMHFLIDLNIRQYLKQVVIRLIILTLLSFPIPFCIVYMVQTELLAFIGSSIMSILSTSVFIYYIILNEDEKGLFKQYLRSKFSRT